MAFAVLLEEQTAVPNSEQLLTASGRAFDYVAAAVVDAKHPCVAEALQSHLQ